jgi:glycosyltransferase involved in cell wall biosynthesis
VYNAIATAGGAWLAEVARAWRADHIHAHWAHLTATLAMAASRLSGIPWSFTAHRYDVELNNLLAEKLRSARFGRFIAREILERARPSLDAEAGERAVLIHMGVCVPPLPAPPERRDVPVLLCPARLVPIKGHRFLIDAAARLVARGLRFELRLAGDGPEAPAIALRIDELGLGDRVRMLGTVPHAELLELYRDGQVDGVVLPSLYEGISVALMEAMAHGVPVVATRVGGVPELLQGGAGLLVPPEDPTALADALEQLVVSRPARLALGEAGRGRVEEEFDVAAIADRLARGFAGASMEDPVGASCRGS